MVSDFKSTYMACAQASLTQSPYFLSVHHKEYSAQKERHTKNNLPPHFQAVKTPQADPYLKLPLY